MQTSRYYLYFNCFALFYFEDPSAVEFTRDDWKLINQRWTQTALPKQDEETKSTWSKCSETKGMKVALQHKLLGSWLIDPTCGKLFKQQVSELMESSSTTKESQWVSKKELMNSMDESEAEEMLELGTLEWRKNPLNKKRLQFKKVTVKENIGVTKSRAIKTSGTQAAFTKKQSSK